MKKIAIIVTMLLTISTFAQVNPSQPTQNSENAAHKRNNQAVFFRFLLKKMNIKLKVVFRRLWCETSIQDV
ncbi:MAG: hypothetical protein IJR03_08020 [Bacteroidales bacterium]|nr:hypothetical protein [Bacteroidales bacterium]